MRLLLDTHALVWWIRADPLLSSRAHDAISSDGVEVLVSIASAWEIAVKVGREKWPDAKDFLDTFELSMAREGFALLPITVPHVRTAGLLVSDHRDPFDRLLAAQAMTEGMTLVSADGKVRLLGASCLW